MGTNRKIITGGSRNPVIFNDYDSFVAKFTDKPKTTDECWTPRDVYEAVVKYVGEIYQLEDKQLLRPFYPGGDYEAAEYPADGIVVVNPPFSIFAKVVRFYLDHNIPFFLFGPALTMTNVCKYGATAVFINRNFCKTFFSINSAPQNVAKYATEATLALKTASVIAFSYKNHTFLYESSFSQTIPSNKP